MGGMMARIGASSGTLAFIMWTWCTMSLNSSKNPGRGSAC